MATGRRLRRLAALLAVIIRDCVHIYKLWNAHLSNLTGTNVILDIMIYDWIISGCLLTMVSFIKTK